jgi:deoxyribodipyrimidine photo-lyase
MSTSTDRDRATPGLIADFVPTRAAALKRLEAFLPRAGRDYARQRNFDRGPGNEPTVSMLAPHLRRRLLSEQEVLAAALDAHGSEAAGKFIEEVLWRTYWKGWLQLRPAVWTRYLQTLRAQREDCAREADLARRVAAAEAGATGIEGFDDWARELVRSGYLHNHARMSFASIWIFTLQLPWALGADFFARHLLDFDPASNTLSWRWVAGLQTPGKVYLASAEAIAACSEGRFRPRGLATEAGALSEPELPPARTLPEPDPVPAGPALLLVHSEDLDPRSWLPASLDLCAAVLIEDGESSAAGEPARRFQSGAFDDVQKRLEASSLPSHRLQFRHAQSLAAIANETGASSLVCAEPAVGPLADKLDALTAELAERGLCLHRLRRPWDAEFWPQARRGFFDFRRHIPTGLRRLRLPVGE